MTRSQRVGVRFDESFPDPPSVGALADRLNRPVERVERGPTVLFTDDPSTVRTARVVVTTDPDVCRVTDATVVRWSHDDPPWVFLDDALADATVEGAASLDAARDRSEPTPDAAPVANDSPTDDDSADSPTDDGGLPTENGPSVADRPASGGANPADPAVHGDDTATTQSANATADPAETAGTTADAVATTGVNAEGTDTPDVTDEATDTADAADSTEVSGEITDVSTDPTDTADAADSTDVNADTGEGDVESHAGDGAGGAFRAGGEPHTLGRADDGRSEDAPSRAATAMTEPAVTLRTDERPRIAAINEAFASLAEGPVVGHPPTEDRLPAAVADRLRRAVARARADERGPSRHALTVDRPEGRRHYVAHDAPYDGGARSLVVFTEVTALKRSETQTAVLTRILRHNLRNEVTVARGYAERIEREAEDAGLVRAARRIVDATATLAALGETAGSVQSVLTGTETQWTTHDLPDLLARVASRVADRHGVNVAVETVEPDGVVGTQHLERALVELAENAVLHGGGDPRLSAERLDGAVRITVRDDGPGIPDPEWAVVAERREITQLRHASGLGLWLVRWVVENNGGRLERHEDDETCVVVHLPRE